MKPSSLIVRIGPLLLKRYQRHRHASEVSPALRVEREIAGSLLLSSEHVEVAGALWASPRLGLLLRRWYDGVHPQPPDGLTEPEVTALGAWLCEHRDKGVGLDLPGGRCAALDLALRRFRFAVPAAFCTGERCFKGSDLVHGDLRPGNIIRTERGLVVIDTETVSASCIAWDAAHLIGLVTGPASPLVPLLFEVARLTQAEAESALALADALSREAVCASSL